MEQCPYVSAGAILPLGVSGEAQLVELNPSSARVQTELR